MQVLLGHEAAHAKHIIALGDAKFTKIFGEMALVGRRNSIIYKAHTLRAAVLRGDKIADYVGNHYYPIGKAAAKHLAKSQHHLSRSTPLLAVVVGTMVRENHLHTQQAGKRSDKCRTYGMNVHHIGTESARCNHSTHSVHYCLKSLLTWRGDIHKLHAMPLGERVGNIAAAAHHRHIIS